MLDLRPRAILVVALTPLPLAAQGFTCDYEPNTAEVILNTDFTQIVPRNCLPVTWRAACSPSAVCASHGE